MGIRKKVALGFACLGLLLIGSGAVSFFELQRIGKRTQQILDDSNSNMAISRDLLDGAEMQHLSLLYSYGRGAVGYDSLYLAGRKMLADALERARDEKKEGIDAVQTAFDTYEQVTRDYFFNEHDFESDWLKESYWNAYMKLTRTVKEFMTRSEQSLGIKAEKIEHAAYRAITPSLVTIGVLLLLLFVLLYFIDFYYMKPVVKMNKGIENWLKFRTPFNVGAESKDETLELRNNIEKLIDLARKGEQKPQ